MKPWKIREETFKLLYQLDINREDPNIVMAHFAEEHPEDPEAMEQIKELVSKVFDNKEQIDNIITTLAKNWSIDRMATTIRSILRLSLAEMLYKKTIPYEISIAEAVKLTKRYGDPKWQQFVNGILGKFIEEQQLMELPKTQP